MSVNRIHDANSSELSKEKPAPSYLHLIRLTVKVVLGFFLLGVFAAEKICGSQLTDLIEFSYIFLLIESGLLALFLIGKYFPNCCLTFVSYYLLAFLLVDLIFDLFYIIWGIYFVIEFADEDECHDQSSLSRAAKVLTLMYWVVFGMFVICGCGSKVCMSFGTYRVAAKAPANSLSQKLLTSEDKTVETTTVEVDKKIEENKVEAEEQEHKDKKE